MTLGIRKLFVLGLAAGVFLLGNLWLVVGWLQDHGVIDGARYVRAEYLTGTAITIIVVLLILLARPNAERPAWFRRCSVCDHTLVSSGRYCTECGSRAR
jgi:hypothetical protein